MSSLALEITVLSGEDLRIHGKSIKKNEAYVTISPYTGDGTAVNCSTIEPTTGMNSEGGVSTQWNQKFVLELPMHCKFLKADVFFGWAMINRKLMGTARIPVSDFTGGFVPADYLHFLSYRLTDREGKRSGILNLSVQAIVPGSCAAPSGRLGFGSESEIGASVGEEKKKCCGGSVATGIPVWRSDRDVWRSDRDDDHDINTARNL